MMDVKDKDKEGQIKNEKISQQSNVQNCSIKYTEQSIKQALRKRHFIYENLNFTGVYTFTKRLYL